MTVCELPFLGTGIHVQNTRGRRVLLTSLGGEVQESCPEHNKQCRAAMLASLVVAPRLLLRYNTVIRDATSLARSVVVHGN